MIFYFDIQLYAYTENVGRLVVWAEQQGLDAIPPTYSAGYDPTWTLPRLKRNEVLIDVN